MKNIVVSWVLALVCWNAGHVVSAKNLDQTRLPEMSFVREVGDVREYRLPNGLQVLLLRDTQQPAMSINITYRVGSRHEGLGESGAAHLLEHMLFKPVGAGQPPAFSDSKNSMLALGMRFNGTTNVDRTNYFAHFITDDGKLPQRLDFMFGWLAAMMTQARFTAEDLTSEMTVVRNEFERADNDASRILADRIRSAAYTTHGYGHPVLGTRADIENIAHERLLAFYKLHYRPDNATLIVTGDFDPADVQGRIEHEFGPIARPDTGLPRTYSTEPVQEGEKALVLRRRDALPRLALAYHAPAGPTREAAAASLLAETLQQPGGPMATAVARPLKTVSYAASFRGLREPSLLWTWLGLSERSEGETDAQLLARARSATVLLARTVESYRPSAPELETARTRLLAQHNSVLRNSQAIAQALSEAVASGDWRLLWVQREWTAQISLEEVHKIAQRHLVPDNRTSGVLLPTSAEVQRSASGSAPQDASQDTPQDTSKVTPQDTLYATANTAPTAQMIDQAMEQALKNSHFLIANNPREIRGRGEFDAKNSSSEPGAFRPDAPRFSLNHASMAQHTQQGRLTVAGKPGLKIAALSRQTKDERVSASLRLRWGTLDTLRGSAALASLLASNLISSLAASGDAPAMNAVQMQNRWVQLDANLRLTSGVGWLTANLEFPAKNTEQVIALLDALLRRPAFDANTFEHAQRALLASLQASQSDPSAVAANLLERNHRAHYAAGDPREVRPFDEAQRQAREATAAQLQAYWKRFASAQQGEFVLYGPVQLAPIQAQLQSLWGNWGSSEPQSGWSLEHAVPVGQTLSWIQVPQKSNAAYSARIALPMNQQHADFAPLFLGIEMLSRLKLYARVREQDGISYGVSSVLNASWTGSAASINLNASFAPQNLQRLRQAIGEVLQQTREQGFSAEQVARAKSGLQARRSDRFNQPPVVLDLLGFVLNTNRALDSGEQLDANFDKTDAAAVNAALKKYLDLNLLQEVAAGSF